jgi:DNA repair exonuclease SbcCD ATPase subunit
MNLNYEKIKAKVEHGGNHWTSYSDLFLVLSVVFLLLFVVANLRTGTVSVATHNEVEKLKSQIKVYESMKEEYLKKDASNEEIQVYQELMSKLTLLEDDAKKERQQLYKQAKEAREKEQNLNRYQAMVQSIINTNLVAKQKLKRRDEVIEENQELITQREKAIDDLNQSVKSRDLQIQDNNDRITEVQDKLAEQIKQVQYAYRSNKRSKEKMEEEIKKLQDKSAAEIAALQSQNTQAVDQMNATKAQLEEKNRQAEKLLGELGQKEEMYKQSMAKLEQGHAERMAKEKKLFDDSLKAAGLAAGEKLKREQAFRAGVEAQNKAYADKLGALGNELANTRNSIRDIEGKYQGTIAGLKNANEAINKNLQMSLQKLNEQKQLAENIKKNFARAGISADVDMKTGDVTVHFGNEYFDTGSWALKPGMVTVLEKMVPVYARSLFEDPKVAKKIASVEIVGFASPTYKGKYVNPDSLSQGDRQAVNYNMDLSYQRAKAIFEHVFDTSRIRFSHQKDLLPVVKVSGRSYLATDRINDRNVSSLSMDNYCQTFDCKKSQRVIIRFNLKDY